MQIRNECTKCDGWGSVGWLFWARNCDHCNGRGYEPPPPGPRPLPPPPPPPKKYVTDGEKLHKPERTGPVKDFAYDLGDEVRDTITSYVGVVIARTQWLTNCNTYLVKSRELKDGKPLDAITFDEPSVELVKPLAVKGVDGVKTGGPTPAIMQTNR